MMFIVPRLIGLSVYTFFLILFCLLISKAKDRQSLIYINLYLIVISVISFFFVPPQEFDLPRIIARMHFYAKFSFFELVKDWLVCQTPGERLYYWLIGQMKYDRLLQLISCFISFFFCFSILKDLVKKHLIPNTIISCVLALFMARGLIMVASSNIRTMFSLSIFSWCIYHEFINNRSAYKNIPFYVVAGSMHSMGQIVILLRVLFSFFEKRSSFGNKVKNYVIILVLIVIFGEYLSPLLGGVEDKAESYYLKSQNNSGYFYFWEGLLSAISIVYTSVLLVWSNRLQNEVKEAYSSLLNFSKIAMVVNIFAAFYDFNLFSRMGYLLAIIDMPLGAIVFYQYEKCRCKFNGLFYCKIFVIVTYAIAASRGYLCSLKFFEEL